MALTARTLFPGRAEAPVFALSAPLSLWGGVDRRTGRIVAARHPERGEALPGRVLVIAEPIGSSSSAAVLLELIANGRAPAAILLGRVDAILVMGCLAAREIGEAPPPVVHAPSFPAMAPGTRLLVDAPQTDAPALIRSLTPQSREAGRNPAA